MYSVTVNIIVDKIQSPIEPVEYLTETHVISATNMDALRKVIKDFQHENDIMGHNWGEAELREDGRLIGYMSYNGRVWKGKYWECKYEEVIV